MQRFARVFPIKVAMATPFLSKAFAEHAVAHVMLAIALRPFNICGIELPCFGAYALIGVGAAFM